MGGKLAATLILALTSSAVHADSLRCGNKLVSESATLDELITKCGQPQSRNVETEDVYANNPNNRARVKTGAQTVKERWIYRPTPGALPMAVQIVDGKIVSITRAE
jgi:hypothetical protein